MSLLYPGSLPTLTTSQHTSWYINYDNHLPPIPSPSYSPIQEISLLYTQSLKETRPMANALAGQKLSIKVSFLFLLKSVMALLCLIFRDESVTLLPICRQKKKKRNSFFYFLSFCGGWAGMRESCQRVVEVIYSHPEQLHGPGSARASSVESQSSENMEDFPLHHY